MEENKIQIVEKQALAQPIATPQQLLDVHANVTEIIKKCLIIDVDYGKIPGTNKETLWKPGAEKICAAFGCAPEFELIDKEIDHDRENKIQFWDKYKRCDSEKTSYGLYRYVYKCRLLRPNGQLLGEGDGSCSTLEAKYITRPRDCENTVVKMAQKRAHIAATLLSFGLSGKFTQDMEDTTVYYDPDKVSHMKQLAAFAKAEGVEDKVAIAEISKFCTGKPLQSLPEIVASYVKNPLQGSEDGKEK